MNKREFSNYEFIKNIKSNIITEKNNGEEMRYNTREDKLRVPSEKIIKTDMNEKNLKTDFGKMFNFSNDMENRISQMMNIEQLDPTKSKEKTLSEYWTQDTYGSTGEHSIKSNTPSNKSSILSKDKKYSYTNIILSIAFTDDEWNEILKNKSLDFFNLDRIKLSLKSGINDNLRGKIWMLLSKCLEAAVFHNVDIYYKLLEMKDEEVDSLIQRDLERTILNTIDENGKLKKIDTKNKLAKLFRILKAYAMYDNDVSYMQGTNFIVAVLLEKINSERACFWIFYQIMNKKGWRNFFIEHTPKLIQMLKVLNISIQEEIPKLYKHFEKENFVELIPAVFTQFFVTLCSYNAPIEYACRIIDLFWIYEEKIIFDAILHLLKLQYEKLITMDAENMHRYIKTDMIYDVINTHGLEKAFPS